MTEEKKRAIADKATAFTIALADCYKDEDNRLLNTVPKISTNFEKDGVDLTDDIYAMLIAYQKVFEDLTGRKVDVIEFTHMLNRLAVQNLIENGGKVI